MRGPMVTVQRTSNSRDPPAPAVICIALSAMLRPRRCRFGVSGMECACPLAAATAASASVEPAHTPQLAKPSVEAAVVAERRRGAARGAKQESMTAPMTRARLEHQPEVTPVQSQSRPCMSWPPASRSPVTMTCAHASAGLCAGCVCVWGGGKGGGGVGRRDRGGSHQHGDANSVQDTSTGAHRQSSVPRSGR